MDLGWPEVLLILAIILIIFGVGKLPQVMESLGKGIRAFRKAQSHEDEQEKDKAKNEDPKKDSSSAK
jgi:sec-independent protein translocase protein TatA